MPTATETTRLAVLREHVVVNVGEMGKFRLFERHDTAELTRDSELAASTVSRIDNVRFLFAYEEDKDSITGSFLSHFVPVDFHLASQF